MITRSMVCKGHFHFLIWFYRCERMLHPGDYPSQFYDEEDDERDVNSAVKTALTVLGKVHSMTSFISYQLTLRLSNTLNLV